MDRRKFVKSVSAAAVLSQVPFSSFGKDIYDGKNDNETIKPKRLSKGDTIGLISPAGFIREDQLKESVENLEALGFKVVYNENILARHGYLGGEDEMRAREVNSMFEREDVDGIVCTRGGYGCARILPLLNYDLIKNNPKALIGYSDITSLLYAIYSQTGLVCFHGPVGISTFNDYSVDYFKSALMQPQENLVIYKAEEKNDDDEFSTYAVKSGKAIGILTGGNLSIVVSMIGTKYDISSEDKIIFLEEIGEEPYRIDRMLTQMKQAGKFNGAAGIAMGVFKNSTPKPDKSGISNSFTIKEIFFDILGDLGIPIIYGLSFGHITNKSTLPLGVEAELNTFNQTITLLEPSVL